MRGREMTSKLRISSRMMKKKVSNTKIILKHFFEENSLFNGKKLILKILV